MYQHLQFKNILVALDGSDSSRMAYEQAIEFQQQKKEQFDQFIIAHITDRSKKYLPEKFQAETIFEQYKEECEEKFAHNKYKLVFEEKSEKQPSCREQILGLCNNLDVSFLFIGFEGRKGPKKSSVVLSQTVTQTCLHSKVPVVITKNVSCRANSRTGGFKMLVGVDGSNKSFKALNYALLLASNPQDEVIICYAPTPDKSKFSKTVKAKTEDFMLMVKNANWRFVQLEESFNPSESIVKFSAEAANDRSAADFVIIGNDGYRAQLEGKEFFGPTAESIVLNSRSNLIIVV